MTIKSPFYVVEEFISPLMCEDIIQRLNNIVPNQDDDGNPLLTVKENELTEIRVMPALEALIPTLEQYYNFKRTGVTPFEFEWYPANVKPIPARCGNSSLINGTWVRTSNRDFVGTIFLNNYQDSPPFDDSFEVVGGKLGYPNHSFSFLPQRGQLIIHPGSPHFLNANSPIQYGELNQIRFYISAETPYEYEPAKFPGSYTKWFA